MNNEAAKKIADIMHNLDQRAVQALMEQRYEDALTVYEEVLKAYTDLKLEKERGHTLLNIANTLMALNRPEEALSRLNEAAAIPELTRDSKDQTVLHMFRANTLLVLKRLPEAERLLSSTLRSCRTPLQVGQLELLRFNCYWQSGQRTKARGSVDRAIQSFEQAQNREELMRALQCRIRYFEASDQSNFAAGDHARMKKLMEEQRILSK